MTLTYNVISLESRFMMSFNTSENINLHVHSTFSDGRFSPETLVLQAIEKNIAVLGFTDHYNTSKTMSIAPNMLEHYLDELDSLATRHDTIRILKGIEINTLDMFLQNRTLPDINLMERLDFILFEYIANIPRVGIPLAHAVLMTNDVPVSRGLAHTDLSRMFPDMTPDECVDRIINAGFFIELNESYRRPGETDPFYVHYTPYFQASGIAALRFSVGTDSHGAITSATNALSFLQEHGLTANLIVDHR
jgi:histidinol phosphatase-like PHP family hydrolase